MANHIDIESTVGRLRADFGASAGVYMRRPDAFQVILPIFHEDGDMIDVYLQPTPQDGDTIRICDFGLTLMRLSYSFQINTNTRERIFESMLAHNSVHNDGGNLYLDTSLNMLSRSILQFSGCVQKVCNMRYWHQEVVRSEFMEHLNEYIPANLSQYEPEKSIRPLPQDYEILKVDWRLKHSNRNFYLFGVPNNDKAVNTAVALLEFQKAKLSFTSIVVHEDMVGLSGRTLTYLTKNADKQFPTLDDFREGAESAIERLAT